ncbi:hypothetical protein VTO42DRAFT_8162 [Malbranchea cinnamomea]
MAKQVLPIFFALSAWAVYAIFVFSVRNGFFAQLQHAIDTRSIPPSEVSLQSKYTGILALDELLLRLVPFFLAIVDGSSPGLSLHSFNFTGALAGLWTLVCLESSRKGNRGKLIALASVFGMICQVASFGLITPLYTAAHLLTSPTAERFGRDGVFVPYHKIMAIPFSIIVGFLLPSLIMCLPESAAGVLQTTQERIAFWQFWPVWVSIAQFVFSSVIVAICRRSGTSSRCSVRNIYAFALCCAAIPHVAAWTISLTSMLFPTLFSADVQPSLHPAYAFLNKFPWSAERPSSIGEGALWFLQWDQLLGSLAMLTWSIALRRSAHTGSKPGKQRSLLAEAVKAFVLCLTVGVAGAAIVNMWQRDEMLLGAASELTDERKRKEK